MFLHLGGDTVINSDDIIAIMDMETTSVSKITREYLTFAEKNNDIVNVSFADLPKSYVIARSGKDGKKRKVYISPISSITLQKRTDR
ncbi:MAG: DUF370 domain-containing protein [Clostridia bacterium]|nr:DUF370 domain-containing protein [Clostridia bacterium]